MHQIEEAQSKIKSAADFPYYVQELIKLCVTVFNTYVNDGHSEYFGKDNYAIQSNGKYTVIQVAENSDTKKFTHYLKIHQQGATDYATFCKHSAETGVEKWVVDTNEMTCTYYDKTGNKMLEEAIPVV